MALVKGGGGGGGRAFLASKSQGEVYFLEIGGRGLFDLNRRTNFSRV